MLNVSYFLKERWNKETICLPLYRELQYKLSYANIFSHILISITITQQAQTSKLMLFFPILNLTKNLRINSKQLDIFSDQVKDIWSEATSVLSWVSTSPTRPRMPTRPPCTWPCLRTWATSRRKWWWPQTWVRPLKSPTSSAHRRPLTTATSSSATSEIQCWVSARWVKFLLQILVNSLNFEKCDKNKS